MEKKRNRENISPRFRPDECKGDGRMMVGVKKREEMQLRQLRPGLLCLRHQTGKGGQILPFPFLQPLNVHRVFK